MSTQADEERIVVSLGAIMLGKLRANGYKAHWLAGVDGAIVSRRDRARVLAMALEGEVGELVRGLNGGGLNGPGMRSSDLRMECADVANYAAMIADVLAPDS